jgi:uncharacterized membrane protein
MTLVTLSLASRQFGPRLLRNFMRDKANQMVLGVFVATFLFCILVLRAVRRADESLFVPQLSVAIGVVLAVASLAVLIYFIHHVAMSIQADEVVARIGGDLLEGIERLFPRSVGEQPRQASRPPPELLASTGRPVETRSDGYLERIDPDLLMEIAVREELVLRLEARPGDYLPGGRIIVMAWPAERVDDKLARRIEECFAIGLQRTPAQDLFFSIHQLVEIAVRALSPATNDPFTPITVIDRLTSGLRVLAGRELPYPLRTDEDGRVRVIAPAPTFGQFLDAAFDPIRRHAAGDPDILMRLLEAIRLIAPEIRRTGDRKRLRRQAWIIELASRREVAEPADRRKVRRAYAEALEALAAPRDDADAGNRARDIPHG